MKIKCLRQCLKQKPKVIEKKLEEKIGKSARKKRLDKLSSKGKTETTRYKKLKEKVYNPFPEEERVGRRKAVKRFKKGYMDRETKYTGLAMERPVRPGENLSEYNREKNEHHYSKIKKTVTLLPTDDADRPVTKGIKKRNLGSNFKK